MPLELHAEALPDLHQGELLVRNVYATLCRSDVNTWSGKRVERVPTILGHEIVGRIAAFGPDAPRIDTSGAPLAVGDRVTWAVWASDPDTELARRGLPQKAPGLFKYGHERWTPGRGFDGGLADYTVLRRHTLIFRIADAVPDAIAAPINCAFATVAGALRLAGDLAGRSVVVSGTGMLGLIACAMVHDAGARLVTALDVDPARLETAQRFGATRTLHAEALADRSLLEPVDVVLEFSGSTEAVEASIEALDIGGVAVWVGSTHPDRSAHVDAERVVRNLLTLRGLHNYIADDLAAAVRFVERRHAEFPFGELVRGGFSLADAEAAFRCAHEERPFRVGIRHESPRT